MKIMSRGILIAALAAFLGVGETKAQGNPGDHPPTMGGMGPCRLDVERFCPGKRDIGPQAVQACLVAHVKEISLPCQEHLVQEHAFIPGTGSTPDPTMCQPDQIKYCPETPFLDSYHLEAAYDCLARHIKELHPGCKSQVQGAQLRAEQKALAKVAQECKEEASRFCQGVESKGFLLLDCLLSKKIAPVTACKEALAAAKPYRQHRRDGRKAGKKS